MKIFAVFKQMIPAHSLLATFPFDAVADPGFPVGGRGPRRGGRGPPRWLRFENFACQNERIWTPWGGGAPGAPPRSANVMGTF